MSLLPEPITITITNAKGILTIATTERTAGSQYDHKARSFLFSRPEEFADDDLVLYFKTSATSFAPAHLNDENEYVITDALTQTLSLTLQVAFRRDGVELAHSGTVGFSLRPSVKAGDGGPPASSEDVYSGGSSGGGSSGGGSSSDDLWKPAVSAAGDISWAKSTSSTVPTPRNIKGPKGDDGAPGPEGPAGSDGTSITILGSYDSLGDLTAAHPTGQLGDGYLIAGDLYVWAGSEWQNVGAIQGPKGPTGEPGAIGPTGPSVTVDETWIKDSTNPIASGAIWAAKEALKVELDDIRNSFALELDGVSALVDEINGNAGGY